MPDIIPADSSAIVVSVLGTVSILTTGAVALGKHLQTIFFSPLLGMIKDYLLAQTTRDTDIKEAMDRLEKEVAAFPRCNHTTPKG